MYFPIWKRSRGNGRHISPIIMPKNDLTIPTTCEWWGTFLCRETALRHEVFWTLPSLIYSWNS